MRLSIIIVSYNQPGYLEDCIDSIYDKTAGIDFEVIVVDNDSPDKKILPYLESCSRRFKNFRFVKNSSNYGFARANNIGYSNSAGDYLVFLNPDTVLTGNSFKEMICLMESDSDLGICGPRLLNTDMSFQVSFYSFPTVMKRFLKVMGINKILARRPFLLRRLFRFKRIMPEYASMFSSNFEEIVEPVEVPWVTGACLMIRRDLFEEIGYFDEGFLLYAEDMDLCLRVRKAGKKIIFFPGARIIHHRGWAKRSIKTLDPYFKSHEYYYRKNFRGFNKNMLLFLNKVEWTYEKLFAWIRGRQ